MIQHDFSNLAIFPVIIASIVSLGIDTLWRRFFKKERKTTFLVFIIRYCALFIIGCGINSLPLSRDIVLNIKQSLFYCLFFVAPCLALDNKKSFQNWFIDVLYYLIQFALLTSITLIVDGLING